MGALESSSLTVALPTFLLGTVVALAVVPLRWLSGLRCYYAASSKEGEAAAARSGGKRVRARGKAGKDAGQQGKDDYDLGGAESLVLARLTLPMAAQMLHRGAFENLASASVFALCALACGQAAERLLGWAPSVLPPAMAFGAVFVALTMLAKVDLASSTTSPTNKVIAAVWGFLGFSAALALHVLQPGGGRLLSWDLRRAAAAVGPTIHALVQAVAGKALAAAGSKARLAGKEVVPGELAIPELAMAGGDKNTVWDFTSSPTGTMPTLAVGHFGVITCQAWQPDGDNWLATAGKDGRLYVYDVTNSVPMAPDMPFLCQPGAIGLTEEDEITTLVFARDGVLYTGHISGLVRRWELPLAGSSSSSEEEEEEEVEEEVEEALAAQGAGAAEQA